MREERIIVHPFKELKIEEYQGVEEVNEHARVYLAGLIPFKKKEEYIKMGKEDTWVQVTAVSREKECTLMYGVIESMKMNVKGGVCRMELTLTSGTALMDCQKKIRSFQSGSLTYGDLLDTCNQGYKNSAKIMTVAKGKSIEQFIMQYEETDWDFIKRLASRNHSVVIADTSTKGEKYYFGLPERKKTIKTDSIEYSICSDMQEYWQKKGKGLKIDPADTLTYMWTGREIYHLGDWGEIDGGKRTVWKAVRELRGNILYHTYYMRELSGIKEPKQHNFQVSGVALSGAVKSVSREKVQIEIFCDGNKGRTGTRWFSYATVYSSEDGTGWYCMPEIGDKIRLYFPTEKEEDAYVISAYHEEGAGLRSGPRKKFWRNKEGKEIQLAPDKLLLTNNNGTYIELSDGEGVKIVSSGSVVISAGELLRISSTNAAIEMSAPEKVKLVQGDTEMKLGGDLDMSGVQIKL